MQPIRRTSLLLIVILGLLAGCATPPVEKRQPAIESDPRHIEASILENADEFTMAGRLFEELALTQASPLREQLLLRAGRDFLRGGDIARTESLLIGIDLTKAPQLGFNRRLLESEIALAENQADQALLILETPPDREATGEELQRYFQNRGAALFLMGKILESTGELMELDLLIIDPKEKLANQLVILDRLATLTDTALELLQPDPPGIQGGWMELARVTKSYSGDVEALPSVLFHWRERFPSHPALPELIDAYREELSRRFHRPERLAVLLPATGPYSQPAAALRAGFLAAYYLEAAEDRPRISFYDSSNSTDIWPLYRQAIDEGAELVIGPLHKEGVAQLLRAGELEIPVLALNQIPPDSTPPENLFQFGLSPEDEARQAADRAWLDGHRQALALVPGGAWGERIYHAFQNRWEQLGGISSERQIYDPAENDFSTPIRSLLNIDESDQRRRDLERRLGRKVEFEPYRRQDADFIFVVAKSEKAREIRPQLQFHHASRLPVYTTSHVFTGHVDPRGDQDLEGIMFPDIPWLLIEEMNDPLSRQRLAEILPESRTGFRRLYAMGIDSYALIPHLWRLQSSPTELLDGRTGILSVDDINQIHRLLVWAEMRGGAPKVLGYSQKIEDDLNTYPVEQVLTDDPGAVITEPAPEAEGFARP